MRISSPVTTFFVPYPSSGHVAHGRQADDRFIGCVGSSPTPVMNAFWGGLETVYR